ncbi:hypothetical protein CI109_105399 [Kwoniella shandongensis]|uniref:Uncharacterized protein n=1 Tax=Kwoniella shandongensis TaxID=1734106 RepID=A0A5M6BNB1_9TREE|nr:uncharacterized protein CI109_007295 [Kwoniella shandongensis]KAA5524384.1 hypothetical protein CI109_007295 [Kwoniella shandongensis]
MRSFIPSYTSLARRISHNPRCYSTSSTPDDFLPLPRSIAHRRALLLLQIPIPPKSWPSHLELSSSLLATTSAKLKSKGIAVQAMYDGLGTQIDFPRQGEKYKARLFWPDGTMKTYDEFGMGSLSSDELEHDLEYQPKDQSLLHTTPEGNNDVREILVCTHGSRDCRCSDRGGPLVDALREEVKKRGLEGKVKIGEVAHVGGHKYAANAIILPSLDMLSNLTIEHAPSLLSHVLDPKSSSQMWAHWRGRYGLTEDLQATFWDQVNPTTSTAAGSLDLKPIRRGKEAASNVEMVKLRFRTFEGEERVVEARMGDNLLEVGKANDLPSLEGVCGGNLECATCHLYLPTNPSPAPVSEASDDEYDMLGYALGFKDGESRLGCQIKVTKELVAWCEGGGVIGLPRF